MSPRPLLAAFAICATATSVAAQDGGQDGIDLLMQLCIPIPATGDSVRAGLRDAGWAELKKAEAAEPLANLVASQMWHLEAHSLPDERVSKTRDYTDAFFASLGNEMLGNVFSIGDQVALVLASGENISCVWAGPESPTLKRRIEAVGGFPKAEGTVTAALSQRVDYGPTGYRRIESYAFIEPVDRAGPLPYAARLDRSPIP